MAFGVEPDRGGVPERTPGPPVIAAPRRILPQMLQPVRRVEPQREAVCRRPVEVHLADRRRPVIQVAEPLAHREHLVGEPGRELRHPDGMRELPRDQRLPARRAEGRVAIRPPEEDPVPRQRVQVRRGAPRVALDPEGPPAVIVGDDQQQVGTFARLPVRVGPGVRSVRQAYRDQGRGDRHENEPESAGLSSSGSQGRVHQGYAQSAGVAPTSGAMRRIVTHGSGFVRRARRVMDR